jgi:hypothetical protein
MRRPLSLSILGVMAARGLLANPALFAGHVTTPASCVATYVGLALALGSPLATALYHVGAMTDGLLSAAGEHTHRERQTDRQRERVCERELESAHTYADRLVHRLEEDTHRQIGRHTQAHT